MLGDGDLLFGFSAAAAAVVAGGLCFDLLADLGDLVWLALREVDLLRFRDLDLLRFLDLELLRCRDLDLCL